MGNAACQWPFLPVDMDSDACAAAAEALRPGEGCQWSSSPLVRWADLVRTVDKPSQPRGCYFYGACRGGCGLEFNPTGHTDAHPDSQQFQSVSAICRLPV